MFAQAPQAAAPAGPVILNLLPVMDDLDKAEEFYHRLLGLESNIGDPRDVLGVDGTPWLPIQIRLSSESPYETWIAW